MHIDLGIKLNLNQKLLMTPQLRQALTILQLSTIELSTVIEQELLENPLLETENSSDTDFLSDLANTPKDDTPNYNIKNSDTNYSLEHYVCEPDSLEKYLLLQLDLCIPNEDMHNIGTYIIGNLDDNGYLTVNIHEIANKFKITEDKVLDILKIIQTFDPVGVAARNLQECLTIQALQKKCAQKMVYSIINNYLELIALGRLKHVANKLECSTSDIQHCMDFIRKLNPKPGQSFAKCENNSYVYPDVTVQQDNGKWVILLEDRLPRLMVNYSYQKMLPNADETTKKYINNSVHSALWLIKNIDQRQQTLYKVMEAIVNLQKDFFCEGPRKLQPMTLKAVAEHIGVHESTVSRATNSKYVNTPHGLFSLKTFFSAGLQTSCGELSRTNIKTMIKEMICTENNQQPLTDQTIADILNQKGIKISRRTIVKYREELDLPTAKLRKSYI